MRFGGNPIEGSNPSLSANSPRTKRHLSQVGDGLLIRTVGDSGWWPGWRFDRRVVHLDVLQGGTYLPVTSSIRS